MKEALLGNPDGSVSVEHIKLIYIQLKNKIKLTPNTVPNSNNETKNKYRKSIS
jgi:hypothetical protein